MLQSPQNLPPLFNREKLVVYGILKSKSDLKKRVDCTAVLKGNVLGKSQKHKVPFTLEPSEAPSQATVHHLAAKALITDWENEDKGKKSIVKLSVEASVISSHTAFIAVDEQSSEPVTGTMKKYDITTKENSSNYYVYACDDECSYYAASPEEEEIEELPQAHATTKRSKVQVNTTLSAELSEEVREDAKAEKKPFRGRKEKIVPRGEKSEDILFEGELDYELASWSEGEGQERILQQREKKAEIQAAAEKGIRLTSLSDIITAQHINGSWTLDSALAQQVGKSLPELESACSTECKGAVASVWATVLALSLLRARYSSQQDEWELIAMKAESWLKKQSLPAEVSLDQLFQEAKKIM